MLLWVSVGVMTLAAVAAVLWPLFRRAAAAVSGSDAVVYRDQLQEIERDLTVGLIGRQEAEAARIEVSRRLLAAKDRSDPAPLAARPGLRLPRQAVAGLALVLLTAGSAGLYLRLGSPGLAIPAAFAGEANAAEGAQPVEKLIAQAEEYLARNPRDAHGWEVLAPVYMRLGRFEDAANAWRNAVQFGDATAERLAGLGESLTAAANGVVTAEAKDALVRAVALDGNNIAARYYLGIAAEQDGKRAEAAKMFRALIAQAPADAHWVGEVRSALARVDGKPDGLAGPTPAEMLAASKQAPGPQDSMIRGMVDRLAEKLKQDGSDPEGWARLVNSWRVLGDSAKHDSALADAKRALAGDKDKLAKFETTLAAMQSGAAPTVAQAPESMPAAPPPAVQVADAKPPQDSVTGMVQRLANRLKQDGSDVDGWLRLIHSYKVLGDEASRQAAIGDATKALAGDAAKTAKLQDGLKAIEAGQNPAAVAAAPHGQGGPAEAAGADSKHDIDAMVERLAERLNKSGGDPEGWLMLTRSYATMQKNDKVAATIAQARKALASDPQKLDWYDQAIVRFKLGQSAK